MPDLDSFWQRISQQIPLVKAMGMELSDYSGQRLTTQLPLAGNINDKGTGFAGSISAALTFTPWCLIQLGLEEQGLELDLAVVSSQTQFLAPVTRDMLVTAEYASADAQQALYAKIAAKGKGSVEVVAVIKEGDIDCARYQGTYVAYPKQS